MEGPVSHVADRAWVWSNPAREAPEGEGMSRSDKRTRTSLVRHTGAAKTSPRTKPARRVKQRVCAALRLPGSKGTARAERQDRELRDPVSRVQDPTPVREDITDAAGRQGVGWARSSDGKARPSRDAG